MAILGLFDAGLEGWLPVSGCWRLDMVRVGVECRLRESSRESSG